MIVRIRAAFFALAAVLLLAACGGDPAPTTLETDEPAYREGKLLERQGRNAEALADFLKVIERRGERAAPESHFEAGYIYLYSIKNPVEAIHHFNKYLETQPNSREAPKVRELLDTARREFARTLPGRLEENQTVRLEVTEELERLRKENEELRAELATLRGLPPARAGAASPPLLLPGDVARHSVPNDVPVISLGGATPAERPPVQAVPPPTATANNFRPAAPKPPPVRNAAPTGRTHTVREHESLWNIARHYYGSPTAAQVNRLFEANRDRMKTPQDLKPGMVLRIP